MSDFDEKLGRKIKAIREEQDVSQERLAKAIKVSRPAVTQIESGDRKVSAEELKRLSEFFNIPPDTWIYPQNAPQVILPNKPGIPRSAGKMRINVPQKNYAKFREVLLFILNKIGSRPNIGQTVLYKLLYFIDFDYYEKYEEQLIGATYQKNHFGPTPVEFAKIVKQMVKKGDLEEYTREYSGRDQKRYTPLREPDLAILNGNEIKVIDQVVDRLSGMSARQVSEYSHQDVPWLTARDGGMIEYESVFYRTESYSVRDEPTDVQ